MIYSKDLFPTNPKDLRDKDWVAEQEECDIRGKLKSAEPHSQQEKIFDLSGYTFPKGMFQLTFEDQKTLVNFEGSTFNSTNVKLINLPKPYSIPIFDIKLSSGMSLPSKSHHKYTSNITINNGTLEILDTQADNIDLTGLTATNTTITITPSKAAGSKLTINLSKCTLSQCELSVERNRENSVLQKITIESDGGSLHDCNLKIIGTNFNPAINLKLSNSKFSNSSIKHATCSSFDIKITDTTLQESVIEFSKSQIVNTAPQNCTLHLSGNQTNIIESLISIESNDAPELEISLNKSTINYAQILINQKESQSKVTIDAKNSDISQSHLKCERVKSGSLHLNPCKLTNSILSFHASAFEEINLDGAKSDSAIDFRHCKPKHVYLENAEISKRRAYLDGKGFTKNELNDLLPATYRSLKNYANDLDRNDLRLKYFALEMRAIHAPFYKAKHGYFVSVWLTTHCVISLGKMPRH